MNLRKLVLCFTAVFLGIFFFFGYTILGMNIEISDRYDDEDRETVENTSSTTYIPKLSRELREPFNVLVLGGDKVNKNSDTMIVANVNCKKNRVTLLSIPRDTRVLVKGKLNKINSAYPRGGEKLAVKTVKDFLNIDIRYFVYLDTKAFREIVDLFGGVDFEIPVDMDYDDPVQNLHIHLKKGYQHLDGDLSEQFMRFRHYNNNKINKYYDGSDLNRITAQQNFIKAFIKQKLNIKYLSKLSEVIDTVYDNIDTNINIDTVLKNLMYFSTFDMNAIDMLTLPGEAQYIDGLSYYLYDRKATYEIIKEYFAYDDDKLSLSDFLNYNNYTTNKDNKNYLKDNPSNDETSIESSGIE